MRKLPTTGGTRTHDTLNSRKSALPAEQPRVNYQLSWPTIKYILMRDGEGTKKKASKQERSYKQQSKACTYMFLMRDEKEEREKQARSMYVYIVLTQ